jgi:hypothetical protein
MTRINLLKRLEELECRILPEDEPVVIQIVFVSSDGTKEDGPRFGVQGAGGSHLRRRGRPGWKR